MEPRLSVRFTTRKRTFLYTARRGPQDGAMMKQEAVLVAAPGCRSDLGPSSAAVARAALLRGLLCSTLALNLVDGLFTLLWVQGGVAEEANPLLTDLVEGRPELFLLVKLVLVAAGLWILWRKREHRLAAAATYFCFMVYYAIVLFHAWHLWPVLAGGRSSA